MNTRVRAALQVLLASIPHELSIPELDLKKVVNRCQRGLNSALERHQGFGIDWTGVKTSLFKDLLIWARRRRIWSRR